MMLWNKQWRESTWKGLSGEWDMIIIGGGITGAGILREATNAGLKALLLEANDFAFGTSSRSSKLIHGGFRYMANRQFDVTYESVKEREWLLKEAPNLVTPLELLIPIYESSKAGQYRIGTIIYDLMGKKWHHRFISGKQVQKSCPILRQDGLKSGILYYDAQMDDSRMALRLIRECVMDGASALNYASVTDLTRDEMGRVNGVVMQDQSPLGLGNQTLQSKVVVNAAGPWSDTIRQHLGGSPKIRQLRGSHLVFPLEKIPLQHGVTLVHPDDGRAMFALPWEGTTIIGTTDLDHGDDAGEPGREPYCTEEEIKYLLRAVDAVFPGAAVTRNDIISSMAGLRPIVSSGRENPSDESRAHCVWDEDGLISVGGGKYTIFRIMARDVLNAALNYLSGVDGLEGKSRFFKPLSERFVADDVDCLDVGTMNYLSGRYGLEIEPLTQSAQPEECSRIESLPNVWAELRWSARAEAVVHLDDLLLRRVRLGLLLPNGAEAQMARIRSIVQPELGWSDQQWEAEYSRYRSIWQQAYSPYPAAAKE